jgi:hypothetical protein
MALLEQQGTEMIMNNVCECWGWRKTSVAHVKLLFAVCLTTDSSARLARKPAGIRISYLANTSPSLLGPGTQLD